MADRIVFLEQRFKATHDVEASGSGLVTILPGHIPSRKDDAPHVSIKKNAKYPLVNPIILKGVCVMGDILDNLKKLLFFDHDLRKFKDFKTDKYMESVQRG